MVADRTVRRPDSGKPLMPVRWQALRQHRAEAPWLVLDLVVMALIAINLLWLLADNLLLDSGAGLLLQQYRPELVSEYRRLGHRPCLIYDTLLTGFLIGELLLRWGIAILRRTHHRWFFYPFVHWYDVLGCLPGLQALRLCRLVSIFYRLNRMGLLLIGGGLIATARKYYNLVLEEISDRIVLNVLEGVRQEIRNGGPVSEQVRERILDPHREALVRWLSVSLSQVAEHGYRRHEGELAEYLEGVVVEAVHRNPEWRALKKRLPLVGDRIEQELNAVAGSLVTLMAARILTDLGRPGNRALTVLSEALYDNFTRPDPAMSRTVEEIALEALELVKAQVAVQQWKVGEGWEKS